MQNKIKTLLMFIVFVFCIVPVCRAEFDDTEFDTTVVDVVENFDANEEFSADAIEDYNVEGSLFQQITDLEQEKVLTRSTAFQSVVMMNPPLPFSPVRHCEPPTAPRQSASPVCHCEGTKCPWQSVSSVCGDLRIPTPVTSVTGSE